MAKQLAFKNFHQQLLNWYQTHGRRDLPWRHTQDPYAILVSEIMLQQTQVSTVLGRFYHPFLEKFPSLSALKSAALPEVTKQWQGLGYYRRARYLHEIASSAAPALPSTYAELIKLPGIGRNTAHAVLAFAHHQPYPVMEANVKRVISRIYAFKQPNDAQLWQCAFDLLDHQHPFDYNQAMMDLGAMICTPKAPQCSICPANSICQGKENPMEYPAPKQQKATQVRRQLVLLIQDCHGRIYCPPRQGEFLHGLHGFVELEEGARGIELNGTSYPKNTWQRLAAVQQVYSHFKQAADVYRLIYAGDHKPDHWYDLAELRALPLSNKEQKIIRLIFRHPG